MSYKNINLKFSSLFILISMLICFTAYAQDSSINLRSILKAITPEGKLVYRIDYDYNFPDHEQVYIEQLGIVSGKGRLVYFSDKPNIEVRDPLSKRILRNFIYSEWSDESNNANKSLDNFDFSRLESIQTREMGRSKPSSIIGMGIQNESTGRINALIGGIELPPDEDFLEVAIVRTDIWQSSFSFQDTVIKVLNSLFPLGTKPFQRDNKFFIKTPFFPLSNLPKNLIGEVSLLIAQPFDKNGNKLTYRIQPLMRERRIKESKWKYSKNTKVSPEVINASNNFVGEIINQIKSNAK
jgi:hypothetical protein